MTVPQTFDRSSRTSREKLDRMLSEVSTNELVYNLLNLVASPALILDEHRQILMANQDFIQLSGSSSEALYGFRPGEVLGCIHAQESTLGCGNSPGCEFCGLLASVFRSQEAQDRQWADVRLAFHTDRPRLAGEWQVQVVPFVQGDLRFSLVTFQDHSSENRRKVLERLFFHDIMNSAWGIHELSELLTEDGKDERIPPLIHDAAAQMVEAIRGQKLLLAAEDTTLSLSLEPVDPRAVLDQLVGLYSRTSLGRWARVVIVDGENFQVETDPAVLYRVFENMLKNALEASSRGDQVTVTLVKTDTGGRFQVHNTKVMGPEVQAQLFQRSFTTKDQAGRGLGTYSMKLFGERYLKGRVWFVSGEGRGTTFLFDFPSLG